MYTFEELNEPYTYVDFDAPHHVHVDDQYPDALTPDELWRARAT